MRPFDRHIVALGQRRGGTSMIDVRVRLQDLLERAAVLGDGGLQALDLAAGIDHGGTSAVLADEH